LEVTTLANLCGLSRPDDCRTLWEHLVLEKLLADAGEVPVLYWRDKQHHEVDFVLPRCRGEVDAIECKWEADGFEPKNLCVFRARHPVGKTPSSVPM
jgi:predicted AAA+ superfamily ATPase